MYVDFPPNCVSSTRYSLRCSAFHIYALETLDSHALIITNLADTKQNQRSESGKSLSHVSVYVHFFSWQSTSEASVWC